MEYESKLNDEVKFPIKEVVGDVVVKDNIENVKSEGLKISKFLIKSKVKLPFSAKTTTFLARPCVPFVKDEFLVIPVFVSNKGSFMLIEPVGPVAPVEPLGPVAP
jgi:hypothetical protein